MSAACHHRHPPKLEAHSQAQTAVAAGLPGDAPLVAGIDAGAAVDAITDTQAATDVCQLGVGEGLIEAEGGVGDHRRLLATPVIDEELLNAGIDLYPEEMTIQLGRPDQRSAKLGSQPLSSIGT